MHDDLILLQVIVESNPFGVPLKTQNDAIKLGKDFAKALGKALNEFVYRYKIV